MLLQIKIKKNWENIHNFEIKNLIETINDKPGEYGKEFMKINFDSGANLNLNKILKLHNSTTVVTSVFQEDNKYLVNLCLSYKNDTT